MYQGASQSLWLMPSCSAVLSYGTRISFNSIGLRRSRRRYSDKTQLLAITNTISEFSKRLDIISLVLNVWTDARLNRFQKRYTIHVADWWVEMFKRITMLKCRPAALWRPPPVLHVIGRPYVSTALLSSGFAKDGAFDCFIAFLYKRFLKSL